MKQLTLEEERECENTFYEKVRDIWIDDPTNSNLEWLCDRIERLNVADQKITIEKEQKISNDLRELLFLSRKLIPGANRSHFDAKSSAFFKNHTVTPF